MIPADTRRLSPISGHQCFKKVAQLAIFAQSGYRPCEWIAEKVFEVRGQRSRSYRNQMHFAAEAYILTVWRRGLLVNLMSSGELGWYGHASFLPCAYRITPRSLLVFCLDAGKHTIHCRWCTFLTASSARQLWTSRSFVRSGYRGRTGSFRTATAVILDWTSSACTVIRHQSQSTTWVLRPTQASLLTGSYPGICLTRLQARQRRVLRVYWEWLQSK